MPYCRTCSNEFFVLEHYLRLVTRNPGPFLSTLQVLTGCPRLSQEISNASPQKNFYGRFAFLPANLVNLCGIYLNSPLRISGAHTEALTIIMPVQGSVGFEAEGEHFLCAPGAPFVLKRAVEFCANVSGAADIFIVQLKSPCLTGSEILPKNGDPRLATILETYLADMPFFRNHGHAMERTAVFEHALTRYVKEGAFSVAEGSEKQTVHNERRIHQALHLINERLQEGVDLEAVARDSGLSLRNLYYLMNRLTGMTPYAYCMSRRLIKAREALICNYKNAPLIAEHASKWGFGHQGRFSAYYFEHFNEYPSVTVEHLKRLVEKSRQVMASENSLSAWYTSTITEPVCEA